MNWRKQRIRDRSGNNRLLEDAPQIKIQQKNSNRSERSVTRRGLDGFVSFSSDDDDDEAAEGRPNNHSGNGNDEQHRALDVWNSIRPRTKAAHIYRTEYGDKAAVERRQEYTRSRKRKALRNALLLLSVSIPLLIFAGLVRQWGKSQANATSTTAKGSRLSVCLSITFTQRSLAITKERLLVY